MRTALVALLAACAPEPPAVDLGRASLLAVDLDGPRLLPDVRALYDAHLGDTPYGCEHIPPRDQLPSCDLSGAAARTWIEAELRASGYTVETVAQPGDEIAYNLVAELPGESLPGEIVVIGAHYDAFYGGADDNSTGVAAMLAIARAARRHSFARTLRFVAFDLEERGSAGSTRYVTAGHAEGVVGAVILEAIGYASTAPGSQDRVTGLPLPDVGDFVLVVANESSAPIAERVLALGQPMGQVRSVAVIGGGGPMTAVLERSDNAPFWAAGIPAVMLTDTASFRNHDYHTVDDTPDRLDDAFLTGVARTAAGTVAELAELVR